MQLNIKLLRERNKRKNCLKQWTASLPKSFQSTCSCRCRKRNEMKNKFDSFSGRYTLVKIFVTLDLPFQKSATKAIDRVGVIIAERFLKNNWAIPDLLFYIFVFSLKFLNAAYSKKTPNGWIQTADLWYQKWPFYQLGHNYCSMFCFFKQTLQFLQQINVQKCPSSIRRRESNPWPLECESLPITTRPGFTPNCSMLMITFKGLGLTPPIKISFQCHKMNWIHVDQL